MGGTGNNVRYIEVIHYCEGPLIEVPPYTKLKLNFT